MSEDLEAIQAAMKRLTESRAKTDEAREKALAVAMQGVQAALTELVSMAEDEAEEAPADYSPIVDAIRDLRMEAPDVSVTPTINVAPAEVNIPQTPVALTVQAGESHNHVSVQPSEVVVMPAPAWKSLNVEFNYRGGVIVSATITRT